VTKTARIFYLGDNIDTDTIAPGAYLHLPIEDQKDHCLESIVTNFSQKVKEGDIIVAEENFGTGSSREQAPILLKMNGISAIFAKSFSRLFFRNAINVGLFVGTYQEKNCFEDGDTVSVNFTNSEISGEKGKLHFQEPQGILLDIIKEGGMINYARKKIHEDH
jgi:3-isopropylmalate dehydratase small subunit